MRVNDLKNYERNYNLEPTETKVKSKPIKKEPIIKDYEDSKLTGNDKILSQKEREFFVNMFPENSEQLKKHTLFNKNGKIQTPHINKGIIVDGRV